MEAEEASINICDSYLSTRNGRVQCNFCSKEMSDFSRLKFHLGGIGNGVRQSVPEHVKASFRSLFLETKTPLLSKANRTSHCSNGKDAWSEKEDRILIEAHKELGNKWSEIAKRLVGRTENTIKNHWNATKRKQFCKGKKNDSTSTLLRNYIKSLASPSVIQDQPTNSIEETYELIGLHSQMEYSEDLNALMNYDIDESNYTLGFYFFNDLNDGFLSFPFTQASEYP